MILGLLLAAGLMVAAVMYDNYRRNNVILSLIGEQARIVTWHGQRGVIHAQGRNWPAFSADPRTFKPGQKVLIAKGLNGALKIHGIEEDVEPFVAKAIPHNK